MDSGHIIEAADLELRRARDGKRRLRGKFPYGKRAILDAGGRGRRPRKEEIGPRAFDFAINQPDREVHLLVGHSYDKPLARKLNGSLVLEDTDDALIFDAEIGEAIQQASYWIDFFAGFTAGLVVGLSPGFRVPPPETVPDAEETVEEDPAEGNALIRFIRHAVLAELSLVTRPAYAETTVEARAKPQTIHIPKRRLLL